MRCYPHGRILVLFLAIMLLGGCASRATCNDLNCLPPEPTNDSMVIWWSPAIKNASDAAQSTDYTRVRVPHE